MFDNGAATPPLRDGRRLFNLILTSVPNGSVVIDVSNALQEDIVKVWVYRKGPTADVELETSRLEGDLKGKWGSVSRE